MPKIQRKTQKIFCNSADNDQIAVFGSMATGTPVYSNDVEQLQSNEAYEIGWDAATLEDKAPFMEEMNGMQYGITKQLAYYFQEGIPEYDAGTTYYIGSIVKVLEDNKPVLYTSLTDENLGNNPVTDVTNWERLASRIEEKIASLIPDNSSLIASYAMPSNRYIDLTLGASDSTYIAPANGWVFIMKRATAVSQTLFIGANGVCSSQESYSTNMWMRVYIPIKKNAEFTVSYTAGGETRQFFFIYAEGEV